MRSIIPWKKKGDSAAPSVWNDEWLDHMIDDPFSALLTPLSKGLSGRVPTVDVSENKNEVKVRAELPGLSEEDIDLSWNNGVLTLRGEKKEEKEDKKGSRYYRECSYGSFSRDIPVGTNVDWEKTEANYKKGVLTVKMPKTEKSKKPINIKVN